MYLEQHHCGFGHSCTTMCWYDDRLPVYCVLLCVNIQLSYTCKNEYFFKLILNHGNIRRSTYHTDYLPVQYPSSAQLHTLIYSRFHNTASTSILFPIKQPLFCYPFSFTIHSQCNHPLKVTKHLLFMTHQKQQQLQLWHCSARQTLSNQ